MNDWAEKMLKLQFCVSQQTNTTPFEFKTTGISVYSFEEAMYHVFHHWRESADEFLSEKMLAWVAELGHSYLATKMKELRKEQFAAKILNFLKLVDYFSVKELAVLEASLEKWEMRREWEQLKERGDHFARRNEPAKAIPLYRRALQYEENASILNNLAIQYMQISQAHEGLTCLTRALTLEPENYSVLLNYAEAAILSGNYKKAEKAMKKAAVKNTNCADIAFLMGLMSFQKKEYPTALAYFEKAMETDKSILFYALKAADVHLQMRQYEKALGILQKTATNGTASDAAYYAKEAEIYAAWGDISRAIKSMKSAVLLKPDANSCAKLAAYYRKDYDMENAEAAIKRAIALSSENNISRLENARIKKGLGRTREYQTSLNEILKSFKSDYRKN